jgi:SAM-dependent methyltransferase
VRERVEQSKEVLMWVPAVIEAQRTKRLINKAKKYVTGHLPENWGLSGRLQLDLLKQSGCTEASKVLEIGCGCLNAGLPIMKFLEPGHYVGVEPNKWLIDAILKDKEVAEVVASRKPQFVYSDSFDASSANMLFDFVISHSVLSHASKRQVELFLRNLKRVLKPEGKILASLVMTNRKGKPLRDSNDPTWVYHNPRKRAVLRILGFKAPRSVTHFSFETVKSVAAANGFAVLWEETFREHFTTHSPFETHDWVVFSPLSRRGEQRSAG